MRILIMSRVLDFFYSETILLKLQDFLNYFSPFSDIGSILAGFRFLDKRENLIILNWNKVGFAKEAFIVC